MWTGVNRISCPHFPRLGLAVSVPRIELADGIRLLRDPNLTEAGLIPAAKLAARELGPHVIARNGGVAWTLNRRAARLRREPQVG
jgi:hypothetical protein